MSRRQVSLEAMGVLRLGSRFVRVMMELFVRLYSVWLSPLIHTVLAVLGLRMSCKYPVSCSDFALQELRSDSPLRKSIFKIFVRVLSCRPKMRA